jgi:stage V sporulation protein SpoVS
MRPQKVKTLCIGRDKLNQKGNKAAVAILPESIERKIYLIRGQRVMFSRDLAMLYGVQAEVLNQAVKAIFDIIHQLMAPVPKEPKRRIGFHNH